MQWLVQTNHAPPPASSVERSGAAQGFVTAPLPRAATTTLSVGGAGAFLPG